MKRLVQSFSLRSTILAVAILMTACTAEQIKDIADQISGNEANFSGSYALDDGSGLTNMYISFSKGKMYEYSSNDKFVIAENYIWFTKPENFTLLRSREYSIGDGILYCNGVPYGKIQITEEQIKWEGQVYRRFVGMKDERYSVISVEESYFYYSYQKADVQIPVSVNRTIPSGTFSAQTSDSWITKCEIKEGMLCLSLDENNSGSYRYGSVVLSYMGATSVTVPIRQDYVGYHMDWKSWINTTWVNTGPMVTRMITFTSQTSLTMDVIDSVGTHKYSGTFIIAGSTIVISFTGDLGAWTGKIESDTQMVIESYVFSKMLI